MFGHISVFVKELFRIICILVPFHLLIRESVSRELDWLEAAGILEKVERSDWTAPIVPVSK